MATAVISDATAGDAAATAVGTGDAPPAPGFAERLLAWFDRCGRKDLPWQQHPTPYRVWISEVMLQQTQVATVIPYYLRFIERFPDVHALAAAAEDEVLSCWSGLGYYARARNLHAAARLVAAQGGTFARDIDGLMALPGIGRSTAAAILALSGGARHAILDGNVKRVLARHRGVEGFPGDTAVQKQLWSLAEAHTPDRRVAAYTQAIMDLGATLCTRSRPLCGDCPVAEDCVARLTGRQHLLPAARRARVLPVRSTCFLMLVDADGGVLLERRPPSGVWGGLWGFPECPPGADVRDWCAGQGYAVLSSEAWPPLRHTFSHFHLDITPVRIDVAPLGGRVEDRHRLWYKEGVTIDLGHPAPVSRLLARLAETSRDRRVAP